MLDASPLAGSAVRVVGKVVTTDTGSSRILATDPKHRWIDHIALRRDSAIAWSASKSAFAQGKELRTFEAPSTVGGLAFFPRGFRLAIAHYEGATLWFPNASEAPPEKLNLSPPRHVSNLPCLVGRS